MTRKGTVLNFLSDFFQEFLTGRRTVGTLFTIGVTMTTASLDGRKVTGSKWPACLVLLIKKKYAPQVFYTATVYSEINDISGGQTAFSLIVKK